MTLNLQRVFTLTQKVLPLLRAAAAPSRNGDVYSDPARIINVSRLHVFLIDSSAKSIYFLDRINRGLECPGP
jgi:hypothetical protein